MSVEITGIYSRTVFRDEFDGEGVFRIKPRTRISQCNSYGEITVKGKAARFQKGTPLLLTGEWKEDSYGAYLALETAKETFYSYLAAIEYLSSGIVKGIGPTLAKRIVDQLGIGLFERLEDPSLYQEFEKVRGIREEMIQQLIAALKATKATRELFEYLIPFGGSCTLTDRLSARYGAFALKILRENSYEAGKEIALPLKICDAIAKKEKLIDAANMARLEMIGNMAMEQSAMRGDTFEYQNALITKCKALSQNEYFPEELPSVVIMQALKNNPRSIVEQGEGLKKIYLKQLRNAEINTAIRIHRLLEDSTKLPFDENLISFAEKLCGIQYAPQQKEAFNLLKSTGVAVLTGGPGTGKTTTVKGIIAAYQKMCPKNTVKLCAPTGRAAQRMAESTEMEAVTLHRLLNYRPFGSAEGCIHKDESDPIEADLIIVDEVSMLNIELASVFFTAVVPGTLVILVGDEDQLPAVGAGDVLHDLLFSEVVPACRLTTVYRQAETSYIVKNAHRINNGQSKLVENQEFQVTVGNQIADEIVKKAAELYSREDPFAMQVLTPTHEGNAGVKELNRRIQAIVNPGTNLLKYGSMSFRKEDKVILLRNNYDKGYYNGDIGIVQSSEDGELVVLVQEKEIQIAHEDMQDISLAYAITVHKSQGSEFQHVLLALPSVYRMLTRNLFYTAVTRAKKTCRVFAEPGAIETAVAAGQTGKRKTRLIERLQRPELRQYC